MMNKGTVSSKLVGIIDIFRPDANNAKTRKRKKNHYSETSENNCSCNK